MYKNALRPAWAEINLNNLDFNIKNIINETAKIGIDNRKYLFNIAFET